MINTAILLLVVSLYALFPSSISASGSFSLNQYVTFYGWADNDPPGRAIAYPKSEFPMSLHEEAGGIGTYDDPITFASDSTEWPIGTKLYVPFMRKYIIMEDWCAQCVRDWKRSGKYHIDIWMNSDNTHQVELISCEELWTKDLALIEVNPLSDRPVITTPLFDPVDGVCLDPNSMPPSLPPLINGLVGQYFNNLDMVGGSVVTRVDKGINFNWGVRSPVGGINRDGFSVRWSGFLVPQYQQTYTFFVKSDDGVRLWVDDQLVIDRWSDHLNSEFAGSVVLGLGQRYQIKVEYHDHSGRSRIQLKWKSPSTPKQFIPQSRLFTE